MDATARQVCEAYPALADVRRVESLGNAGGFSGSQLWRVESAAGLFCLRAWPALINTNRVQAIHGLMERASAAGLAFVPRLARSATGATWVEKGGRLWELTTWLQGEADFRERRSPTQLQAAVIALAQLHQAWAGSESTSAISSAVLRRRQALTAWEKKKPQQAVSLRRAIGQFPAATWLSRAFAQCERWTMRAYLAVDPWLSQCLPLQPCLCDIWHDHVLFEGDRVSGIVDYGSVRESECVAADLGRLLGSLVDDDDELWEIGMASYAAVRPLSTAERELARVLDWTGVVVGLGHWLDWIDSDRMRPEHLPGVTRRLQQLVLRAEAWRTGDSRLQIPD